MEAPSDSALAVDVRGLRQCHEVGLFQRARPVLHGIDLQLARGEFVGLVGPNGSGKSTLLRVLAAIDEADEGSVRVFGLDPDDRAARRRTGFCPEDSPFPRELRPLQALDLLGSLHGLERSARRERAQRLLERVGLSGAAKQRLGSFSRGMLRRFGLAQALLHEPDLVLLDEPTAGLDALGFAVVEELLDETLARGATVIVSSHLVSDVHRRSSRIVVLVNGRIAANGSPVELVRALGAGAELDATLSGLDASALDAVRREIERLGGRMSLVRPAQSNLAELYRRGRSGETP